MIHAGHCEPCLRDLPRKIGDHRATQTGPTLVVVGGLHANEPAGIAAASRVHNRIDDGDLSLVAGRFISLRGNLTALAADPDEQDRRQRYIDEDLNRAFVDSPATRRTATATVEQRERDALDAAFDSIAAETEHTVYLLDLHTFSSDSPPFIVHEDALHTRRFAATFPLPKVLGLEEELSGLLIDDVTSRLGFVACIAEAGRHDDPAAIDVHEALILIALQALGNTQPGSRTSKGDIPSQVVERAAGERARRYYDVRQRVGITDESFCMSDDARAFMPVTAKNTLLAYEHRQPITADADGVLFMPNRQSARRPGDDAFFVVQRVGAIWLRISALLRQSSFVQHIIVTALPGVRRRPGQPHTILVAPEYAAILRREILHLLGYRLVRWTHQPYLSRSKRLAMALHGLLRSVFGIIKHALSGGERNALPRERDTDWIAHRRHLDVNQNLDRNQKVSP